MNRRNSSYSVEDYESSGLAFPLRVLSCEDTACFRSAVNELQDRLGGKPPAMDLSQTHLAFKWGYDLVTHPKVLDAVEAVLGPNLIVWSTSIFAKYPRDPGFVSWHQDATYWGLNSQEVTTAWIALTDSTIENGCMRVVPGTHCDPIHEHVDTFAENNQLSRGQEIAVSVNEDDAVDLILKAGEMSLHHVNLIHGSNANETDGKRIGYVIRYVTPAVRQSGHRQPVVLARGVDDYGHFDLLKEPPTAGFEDGLEAHRANTRELLEALRKTKGAY